MIFLCTIFDGQNFCKYCTVLACSNIVLRSYVNNVLLCLVRDVLLCGTCRDVFDSQERFIAHRSAGCRLRFSCKCKPGSLSCLVSSRLVSSRPLRSDVLLLVDCTILGTSHMFHIHAVNMLVVVTSISESCRR